ncbi:hypothetical protein I3843_12G123700 [Carya illinoinensis]|uniref:Uncharacterized protein n=1 Tax=Carya illinoinensis TaxID=32201 RepID=A0A8T1NWJ6_CARIL|nr:uncharacterized protein LOC122289525 [Carya illinoinensis]KAG6634528.1 hypothetical protein CIPAW_12G124700 [Carya illinoinensis]KAG6685673.1 hypothetical protein I3842_12G123400 [Carya illinoinensis]KAG7953720.1 hypothetical protein I3843_12G123700 [Carya illinoinensis]
MGGGGVVRAAAKVSGIGVFNGGIRGVPVMPPAEHSVRNATRPVSAILSSSSASSKTPSAEVSSITAAWDDWEFADSVEELKIEAGEPMPRVVFRGVPSFQEAKEATAELKDALDKVYLSSPKSTGFGDADHVSVLSTLTNPELDSKSCVVFEATPPPVPKNVLQAFKLLSGSPKAQTVVASIASDPNVWNAMMDNSMLKDYLASEQRNDVPEPQSPKRFEESSDGGQTANKENGFAHITGMMRNIKLTVLEMVSNVSNFFQNIFGVSTSDDISSDSNGNAKTAGATFMGLAVLVMMVIVMKRV